MHITENERIVRQFYNWALDQNPDFMTLLDEFIIWIEPGAPDVPFGGVYNGHAGVGAMLQSETNSLHLKGLIPKTYFASQNLVVVLGSDSATVLTTGKTYTTDWAMFFTILDGKISMVQTYMDTNAIAKAFRGQET